MHNYARAIVWVPLFHLIILFRRLKLFVVWMHLNEYQYSGCARIVKRGMSNLINGPT